MILLKPTSNIANESGFLSSNGCHSIEFVISGTEFRDFEDNRAIKPETKPAFVFAYQSWKFICVSSKAILLSGLRVIRQE